MLVTERTASPTAMSHVAEAELARRYCGGKLVLLLEGGYEPGERSRSRCAPALEVMTGARREDFPNGAGHAAVDAISSAQAALRPTGGPRAGG